MTNPIPVENALTGTAKAVWDVTGIGSTTIQGFPAGMSVAQGAALAVKVHSPSSSWTGVVYRLGWYGGDGAREIATISGPQTAQPPGTTDATTGMVSCANWTANGTWNVPADACPGVYLIRIERHDDPALASHVGPFVVTNPARKAPLLVKTSDATWQAYNHCGSDPDDVLAGASIYGIGSSASWQWWQTLPPGSRTRAVSYDRPLVTRHWHPATTIWNAEYPLIRWLERCGYDVDYTTCLDVDADPSLLLDRQAVISSGHDEYWSPGIHDAFTEARDAGVNLVFTTGNEAFWRINFHPSRRSYACWKDTHDSTLNASGVYSGTWQDTRGINPDRRPPALLTGQRFRRNGIAAHALRATAAHAASPLWRDTAVADLTGADTWTSADGIVGFEGDEPADTDLSESPAGLMRLSEASYSVSGGLADDNGNQYDLTGTYTHSLTLYQAASGALVYATGTNQYAWGLDDTHDRHPGGTLASDTLRQALTNVLADMGAEPTSVPDGITTPTPVDASAYGFEVAMANAVFDAFKQGLLNAEYDLNTATIKCALVRGYTFDTTDQYVSDVVATGTINGTSAALTNPTITGGLFDADDTTITTTASASNHGLLVFQASAVGGGSDVAQSAQRLIAWYDTGTGLPIQPGSGEVSVTWSSGSNRILRIS